MWSVFPLRILYPSANQNWMWKIKTSGFCCWNKLHFTTRSLDYPSKCWLIGHNKPFKVSCFQFNTYDFLNFIWVAIDVTIRMFNNTRLSWFLSHVYSQMEKACTMCVNFPDDSSCSGLKIRVAAIKTISFEIKVIKGQLFTGYNLFYMVSYSFTLILTWMYLFLVVAVKDFVWVVIWIVCQICRTMIA